MSDERKAPETPPEYVPEHIPEAPGMRWLPIAEVEVLIDKKERNARYWLDRHEIPARGERPKLFSERAILAVLASAGQQPRKAPERPPEHLPEYPPETAGMPPEPIEAAYRVAGEAAAEVALVPLATMVEELRGLAAELQEMSRRNEALALEVGQLRERQVGHAGQLAAKDAALAAKDETIAELRRRAEQAEAELVRAEAVRVVLADATATESASQDVALADATSRAEGAEAWRGRMNAAITRTGASVPSGVREADSHADAPAGFWARVRRFFGGDEG